MPTELLRRGLKLSHLRLLALLDRTGTISAAAEALGIAQPAASRLLSEAERIAGHPLRQRDGRGIQLTEEGRALARRATRILTEISDADRELREIATGLTGEVRVGAVTGAALDRVLPALRSARMSMPKLRIHVEVGNSEVLGDGLVEGRLDLALARLPTGHPAAMFDIRPIGPEPVALVVRPEHPLLARPGLTPDMVLSYDWVLPARGTILHDTVQDRLAHLGLPAPRISVTTSSFLLTLALVQRSNAVAPLAQAVAAQFTGGACEILPSDLGLSVQPYGLMTRAGAALPIAAQRLSDLLLRPGPHDPPACLLPSSAD